MKILSEIPPNIVNNEYALEQYWSNIFPLSTEVFEYVNELVVGDNNVVLYSGGPRLKFNATYIEPVGFSHLSIDWPQQTLFVDHHNKVIVNYTIKKLNPKNLIILNANLFIRYRLWSDILQDIQDFKKIAERVIVTIPISRFDFNRLKFTTEEIALKLSGVLMNDMIVICQ